MDNGDIVIRDMDIDDIPAVMAMERQLFADPWPEEVFFDDVAAHTRYPFVAQSDNEIVGYAIMWIKPLEGHLTNIAVTRKYQRKNIAKKLLSHILLLAAGMGLAQIVLEVRPSNQPAISLYETFGFEQGEVRKGYYSHPDEDCLVMKKDITGLRSSKTD